MAAEQHILIVEDDNDINRLLAEILSSAGYKVTQAYSGTEARLLAAQQQFSLYLLDLMLPGLTGEELIPLISQTSNAPIIVLSAKETPQDRVTVLRLGADDYMTKPFYEEELIARVEVALRRTQAGDDTGEAAKKLVYKDVELDTQAHTVTVLGEAVALTGREFAILELLMQNPQKVFTKANLYESAWNEEFFGDDNTVNVHISNLRGKLGRPEYIQTVWGIGFKMQ